MILYTKNPQINKQHQKGLFGFEPATFCFLRQCFTTYVFAAVTNYHLNVIDEQVKVHSVGTDFKP